MISKDLRENSIGGEKNFKLRFVRKQAFYIVCSQRIHAKQIWAGVT